MQIGADMQIQLNRIEFKLDAIINYLRIPLEPRSVLLYACEARSPNGKLVKLKAGYVISKIESVSAELGWANVRINDEVFSVPLAFVDIHSKKTQQFQQLYALENNPQLLDALYYQQGMPNQPAFARQYYEGGQLLQSYQPTQPVQTAQQTNVGSIVHGTQRAGVTFAPYNAVLTQYPQFYQQPSQFQQQIQQQVQQPMQMVQMQPMQSTPQMQQNPLSNQFGSQSDEQKAFQPYFNQFQPYFLRQQPVQNQPSNQLALSEGAGVEAADPPVQISEQGASRAQSRRTNKAQSPPRAEPKKYVLLRTDTVPPSEREIYVDLKYLNWCKPGAKSGSQLRLSDVTDVRIIDKELVIRATKSREMKLKGDELELKYLAAEIIQR